jgi:hypothetical protein
MAAEEMCETARREQDPEYREFHRSICLECIGLGSIEGTA